MKDNTSLDQVASPGGAEGKRDLQALLTELAGTQMSTAAFARMHGLPPWKLYQAQRARAKKSASNRRSGALVPVSVCAAEVDPACLELVLPAGYRLRVPAGFDEVSLRRLLGVLAQC